jgi:hypothetical protein
MIQSSYHLNAKAPGFTPALVGKEVITFQPNSPFDDLKQKGTMNTNSTSHVNVCGCTTVRGAA